jgi:hypothetical protein
MSLLSPPLSAAGARADAGRALESLLVQKMLHASGAFHSSGAAGSELRNDLFIEALADAVAKAGGLGLGGAGGPSPDGLLNDSVPRADNSHGRVP